jgi:hypothetical protein
MKKKNKKETEDMNVRKISKWLLLIVLILLVAVAGIVYTLASSSTDITAPVTTSTITGTLEAAPFADFYKDSATVTLAATDPSGVGDGTGGGSAQTLDVITGESPLSATFVAGQPAGPSTGPYIDNFDQGLDQNIWVYGQQNINPNGGVVTAFSNATNPYGGAVYMGHPLNMMGAATSLFAEIEATVSSASGSYRIPFTLTDGAPAGVQPKTVGMSIGVDSTSGYSNIGWDINDGVTTDPLFPGIPGVHGSIQDSFGSPVSAPVVNQKVKLRIEINNGNQIEFKVDINMDGIFELTSGAKPFVLWSNTMSIGFGAQAGINGQNAQVVTAVFDNLVTNFPAPGTPATANGYNLARTGMALNGVNYIDDIAPIFGSPNPIPGVLWFGSENPTILPAIIPEYEMMFTGNSLRDTYVYLMTINMGGTYHVTVYDVKTPQEVAQWVISQFQGAFVVDAFGKALTYNGSNTYVPVTGQIPSEGSIVYNAGTGQGEVLPPATSAPAVSGVNKTYYRIGDTGSFIEYTAPVTVDNAGVNNVYYYSTDNAGNMETVQSIIVKVDRDTDGDGAYNNYDGCPTASGPANRNGCPFAVDINSNLLVNYIGAPKFTNKVPVKVGSIGDPMNESITKVDSKVYKLSVFGKPYGDIQQNCGTYYDSTTVIPVATKLLPNGDELIGLSTKENYVVMQRVSIKEPVTGMVNSLTTCRNIESGAFDSTGLAKTEMPIMKTVKNGKATLSGAQSTVMNGSKLEIFYPENIQWEEGIKNYVYTYVFVSDSDWDVDVCTYTPSGYEIAGVYSDDGILVGSNECTQTFVQNQTKVVAFEVTDVGSPKEFDVGLKLTGKKIGDKKEQKADIKLHTKVLPKDKINRDGSFNMGLLKIEAPKSFMDKLKEKGDENVKISEGIRNRNIGQKVKSIIKRIF